MRLLFILPILLTVFSACKKDAAPVSVLTEPVLPTELFIQYTIPAGQQFCDNNPFVQTSYAQLKFRVRFDSSAVYTNANPANQYDINKLYGFADNSSHHQQYSARFGWRWSDNALRLFGYVYNNGIRDSKELGTIQIGNVNDCALSVTAGNYVFSVNGIKDSLPRAAITLKAEGYKLYPYFGGDETAPHDIRIYLREL